MTGDRSVGHFCIPGGKVDRNTIRLEGKGLATSNVKQCFSTFFDSRHPSLALEQFGDTSILVNRRQIQKLAAPLKVFRGTKGAAAPQLRITDVENNKKINLNSNKLEKTLFSISTTKKLIKF